MILDYEILNSFCYYDYVLESLIHSGVIFGVSRNNFLSKFCVSSGCGVNGHTVTNFEERVNLAHTLKSGGGGKVSRKIVMIIFSKITVRKSGLLKHTEEVGHNSYKTFKRNVVSLAACSHSIFYTEIYCDRKVFALCVNGFVVRNSILVCVNIAKANLFKRYTKSTAYRATKSTVVSRNVSVTNNLTVKTIKNTPISVLKIIKLLADKLNLVDFCVIELSLFKLAGNLLCGGVSCNIRVERTEHQVHNVSNGNGIHTRSGNVHTVCSIHKTNKDKLNVGVKLNNAINYACIIKNEACGGVSNKVSNIFKVLYTVLLNVFGNVGKKLCVNLVVNFKNKSFLLLIKTDKGLLESHLLIIIKRSAKNSKSISYSVKKVSAKGSITDTHSDNVRFGNIFNEVHGKFIKIIFTCVNGNLIGPIISGSLTTAKEIEKILCSHCGGRKLCVLYFYAKILLQPSGKEIGICSIAVSTVAIDECTASKVSLNITVEAIAIRH